MARHEKSEPQGTLADGGRLAPSVARKPVSAGAGQDFDRQLQALRRAQQGDQDAFRWLLETNQRKVFGLAIRTLGCDRHTAADISQEVFLRAFRSIKTFDGRALFSTWLYKITMNLCITEFRKRRTLKRGRPTRSIDVPIAGYEDLSLEPTSREVDPAESVHHKDIATAVQEAVQKLPADFRSCVVLRDMKGLSYEEICEILDLPAGTVRSRIHRGRVILQRLLKEYTP